MKWRKWIQFNKKDFAVLDDSLSKKVREKSKECHNHKPQPFADTKRKRKQTKPNKRKLNKCTKSIKISFLFPKQGNHNTQRTGKHKNKITQGKTLPLGVWEGLRFVIVALPGLFSYLVFFKNKSPRRINHKATKSNLKRFLVPQEEFVQ